MAFNVCLCVFFCVCMRVCVLTVRSPFQYAPSTRASTECLARISRAATEADHEATVLSVDGVGAFDHSSRASMFSLLASFTWGELLRLDPRSQARDIFFLRTPFSVQRR